MYVFFYWSVAASWFQAKRPQVRRDEVGCRLSALCALLSWQLVITRRDDLVIYLHHVLTMLNSSLWSNCNICPIGDIGYAAAYLQISGDFSIKLGYKIAAVARLTLNTFLLTLPRNQLSVVCCVGTQRKPLVVGWLLPDVMEGNFYLNRVWD